MSNGSKGRRQHKHARTEERIWSQVRAIQRDVAELNGGKKARATAPAASSPGLSAADRARLDAAFSTGRAQPSVKREGLSVSFGYAPAPLEPRPTTTRAAPRAATTTSTPRSSVPSKLSAADSARLDAAFGTSAAGRADASVRRTPTSLTLSLAGD